MENNTKEINLLKIKAYKWDVLEESGILEHIRIICNTLHQSQIECSCLQQLVIDNADNNADLPHLKFATKRLMGIINDVYYNKDELNKILF